MIMKNGPDKDIFWSQSCNDLILGLQCTDDHVSLLLKNTGPNPLHVLSHVMAGDIHLDWFRLKVTVNGRDRFIRLSDDRNRSARIVKTLAPGESLLHRVDVLAWAKRAVNGSVPLKPGDARVLAGYGVHNDAAVWNGELEAGPVKWLIPEKTGHDG